MAAVAAGAGLGGCPEFFEAGRAAYGDGLDHLVLGDLETLANISFRAAADGATAMALPDAAGLGIRILIGMDHRPGKAC